MARQTGAGIEAREVAAKPINVGGGGAAAQPDADGGTACLACIARTGAPHGAAPPHSVTIQALPIHVQVVTSKTECLFLPNTVPNTIGFGRDYTWDLRNQWVAGPQGLDFPAVWGSSLTGLS